MTRWNYWKAFRTRSQTPWLIVLQQRRIWKSSRDRWMTASKNLETAFWLMQDLSVTDYVKHNCNLSAGKDFLWVRNGRLWLVFLPGLCLTCVRKMRSFKKKDERHIVSISRCMRKRCWSRGLGLGWFRPCWESISFLVRKMEWKSWFSPTTHQKCHFVSFIPLNITDCPFDGQCLPVGLPLPPIWVLFM